MPGDTADLVECQVAQPVAAGAAVVAALAPPELHKTVLVRRVASGAIPLPWMATVGTAVTVRAAISHNRAQADGAMVAAAVVQVEVVAAFLAGAAAATAVMDGLTSAWLRVEAVVARMSTTLLESPGVHIPWNWLTVLCR